MKTVAQALTMATPKRHAKCKGHTMQTVVQALSHTMQTVAQALTPVYQALSHTMQTVAQALTMATLIQNTTRNGHTTQTVTNGRAIAAPIIHCL